MANGWAPDGAVQDQIEDSIKDALEAARSRRAVGIAKRAGDRNAAAEAHEAVDRTKHALGERGPV